MHADMHACMHACIHTYIHAYVCIYIHTYVHACMDTEMISEIGRQPDARHEELASIRQFCWVKVEAGGLIPVYILVSIRTLSIRICIRIKLKLGASYLCTYSSAYVR
jgi:hypothetical protein